MMKKTLFFYFIAYLIPMGSLLIAEQVVIVGSGPAALTAALYTSRAGLSTTIIKGNEPGGSLASIEKIENFPGFVKGISGSELSEKMKEQAINFGATVKEGALKTMDVSQRPFFLTLEDNTTLYADTLILATGTIPKWLGLKSEKQFLGKGVYSCALCDGPLFKKKEVVVVGGSDQAFEEAILLANYGAKVTLVYTNELLTATHTLQKKVAHYSKIERMENTQVIAILDNGLGKIKGIEVKNLETNEIYFKSCQGIFIALGIQANTQVFAAELTQTREKKLSDSFCSVKTSVPGVFFAGDLVNERYHQVIVAAGMGAMAAIEVCQFIQEND